MFRAHLDPAHRAAHVERHAFHFRIFQHAHAGGPRALDQEGVEYLATDAQAAIAKAAEAMARHELPMNAVARWRMHDHAGQRGGAALFERRQCAHRIQNAARFRTHILGARLGAGKSRAIEQTHLEPRRGQVPRRRTAGGASAHDNHLPGARVVGHEARKGAIATPGDCEKLTPRNGT